MANKSYVLNDYGFTEDDLYNFEMLIDRRGIGNVLMQLSELCGLKAEHIANNWQDAPLAKRWATLEGALGVIVPDAMGL